MKARIFLLSMLLLAAGGREQPEIQGLHAHRQGNTLMVSFELAGAFDKALLERVHSGLPTELLYVLQFENPRRWWLDQNLGRTTLQVVAMYNAVTEEYLVNYKHDGRLIDSRVVTDTSELETAMTMIHALPAFEVESTMPSRGLLRVRAILGSKHLLYLFPRTIATSWARFRLEQQPAPG